MPPKCHHWQLSDPLQPVECLKHPKLCFWALHLWPAFCTFLCLFERTIVHTYVIYCESLRLPTISYILCAPHHFLLAIFPQLKQTLCPLTFWKFIVFDFPSAECLNRQSLDMQYRLRMHLPTFLVPIRSFLLDVFILKYLRSWLICTHSCGEHFILYSLKPFMSCGSSSTQSASILRNKCIGNCNSLSLVLFWSESDCSEVVISESSVRSITSSASSRHICCSRVLGHGLSMVTSTYVCLCVG